MKQQVYEQMQKGCSLHSISGFYESESKYKRNFHGQFLHVSGSNLIVGGNLEDFAHARIEKGFMDKRQLWFNKRYAPGCGVIKFSFQRKGDIWLGKYILQGKDFPVEAKTELIDAGPFGELAEKYKDCIESFMPQLL